MKTTIALAGSPNCGKTTLFNLLTGSRQSVGNWPGVTVEQKRGQTTLNKEIVDVVDLPGVYSLSGGGGLDERLARDFLLSGEPSLIVNVVDASNLERQLGLTVELLDMGTPTVIVLNMIDEAQGQGREVDPEALSKLTGCPVIAVAAKRSQSRTPLLHTLERAMAAPEIPHPLEYPDAVESAVSGWGHPRAAAILRLASAPEPQDGHPCSQARRAISAAMGETAEDVVADVRYRRAQTLVHSVLKKPGAQSRQWSDWFDRVVLHRFWGVPIFLGVMYLLFVVSFSGGNILLDAIDQSSHALFVTLPQNVLLFFHAPPALITLVCTAVGGAIQLVLPFMAPVGLTFFFLTLLEESGYMVRGSFVMDRLFRKLGLPGKTLVPMVVGFGCNVPAVMATRSIENPRDRLIVTMMQPFMSCSARLVIYMAFAAVFFRHGGGQVVFGLYLLGMVLAALTALILGKTILPGQPQPFAMDLPPYRMPTGRSLTLAVWQRLKIYVWRVGRVIATATVIIYLLSSFGWTSKGFGITNDPGESFLGQVGKSITPVFHPMGIEQDNWPATVGLLTGAAAKEVVIGTLNGAYSRDHQTEAVQGNVGSELWAALLTIPTNAGAFVTSFGDPLGFRKLGNADDAAATSGASQATLQAMGQHFTTASALAYLIFVLLYIPCVSTMGAIRRETGAWSWTIFSIVWGVVLAYGLGTSWYQVSTWAQHPEFSLLWLGGTAVSFAVLIAALKIWSAHAVPEGLVRTSFDTV